MKDDDVKGKADSDVDSKPVELLNHGMNLVQEAPKKRKYRKRRNSDDSDWEEAKEPKVSRREDDKIYLTKQKKPDKTRRPKKRFLGNKHSLFPKYNSEMCVGEFASALAVKKTE